MCKIKSTIIKVHGVVTKVVITIPELEMQGAHLFFECVLQGLNMYLDESGIKKLRNLYVQLDTFSLNKSYNSYSQMIYFNEEIREEGGMHSKSYSRRRCRGK